MNNYVILALGWFLGQLGYAAVSAYVLQRDKPGISYRQALAVYFAKEVGSFAMAFCALLIIMFIANDFLSVDITRKDLLNKEALSWKEKIIVYQRTCSVFFGAFSQHIIYVAFKKGKKAIEDFAAKNNVNEIK
jgi:hypothetical protein